MKLVKVVDYTRPYVSKKDGKEHPNCNYYAEETLPNGRLVRVCIKPAFDTHIATDLAYLDLMCVEVRKIKADGVQSTALASEPVIEDDDALKPEEDDAE